MHAFWKRFREDLFIEGAVFCPDEPDIRRILCNFCSGQANQRQRIEQTLQLFFSDEQQKQKQLQQQHEPACWRRA